jgi:hypothetical protein
MPPMIVEPERGAGDQREGLGDAHLDGVHRAHLVDGLDAHGVVLALGPQDHEGAEMKAVATGIGANRWALMALPKARPSTASGRKAMNRLSTRRLASGSRPRPAKVRTLAVFPHHGEDGAGLDDDLEQLAPVVVEVQQVAGEDQVAGAGDRQEFGQAFDHAEDQRLEEQDDVHERLCAVRKESIIAVAYIYAFALHDNLSRNCSSRRYRVDTDRRNDMSLISPATPWHPVNAEENPVARLRPGMFIQELCGDWMSHPFWRAQFKLKGDGDLRRIVESGIQHVYIDTDRGLDDGGGGGGRGSGRGRAGDRRRHVRARRADLRVSVREEMARARKVHEQAHKVVRSMMSDVRLARRCPSRTPSRWSRRSPARCCATAARCWG